MDKKFVSAESEMSVLSTFEQNETLRGLSYESGVRRKKLRLIVSANILASYNNVQKRNDRYNSEFSGAFRVPEFRAFRYRSSDFQYNNGQIVSRKEVR